MEKKRRIPDWIKMKIPGGETYTKLKKIINQENLHTVCLEAHCPNQGECFSLGTATFLIMGNICTRNCNYCSVIKGDPDQPDEKEPLKIARAVNAMGLKYAVITSVTRDDLLDGGAYYFAETVKQIRKINPGCKVELLIPDFREHTRTALREIYSSMPNVIGHNIEVVRGHYSKLRPLGDYELSLSILKEVSAAGFIAKSGLMIGFGENLNDITNTMKDLFKNGCSILTIGQYLQSSKTGFEVQKYYKPEEFVELKKVALDIGFKNVLSGPLVRSSYHAEELFKVK